MREIMWACLVLQAYALLTVKLTGAAIFDRIDNAGVKNGWFNAKTDYGKKIDRYYDFIIIGSGSAGVVIANRLSEIPHWKILLLEAGKPANELTKIPLFAPIFSLTDYNWGYTMEHQNGVCLGMYEEKCSWPRGKALGGTSVINYMIYTRGKPYNYDKWAEMGNPGWSYEDVLPYFLKSEDANLNLTDYGYHQQGGYLGVEEAFQSKLSRAFLQAGLEMGYEINDPNGPQEYGFSHMQATLRKGRRQSVASAFLEPIRNRNNLDIVTSATVTKILIDHRTKTAYGVEFIKQKKKYKVGIIKEVILSAGAFASPQLLMLSGVGPKAHLEEMKIPLIQNLAVGRNLYDHIAHLGLTFLINETVEPPVNAIKPEEIWNWVVNGKGTWTSLGGIEGLAYIRTGISLDNHPDIELIFSAVGGLNADYGLVVSPSFRIKKDLYNKLYKQLENTPTFSIFPLLIHPKSNGYLKLKSKNPFDPPLLYGNYLNDLEGIDMDTFVAAIRFIIQLTQTEPFKAFNATLHTIPVPGCEVYIFNTDPYWRCAVRHLTTSLHHQVSTCKMGPPNDPEAVIDNRLRIYGINSLRVADTSIIPIALSAHTNAPSIMIGEKAADLIKQDWNEL